MTKINYPKDYESARDAYAEEQWSDFNKNLTAHSQHYTTVIKKGADFGFEQGLKAAVEMLMNKAGSYCECSVSRGDRVPENLFCSKHAMTFCSVQIEEHFGMNGKVG